MTDPANARTTEQDITRRHFDAASDYWQRIYDDDFAATFTGYSLRTAHHHILDQIAALAATDRVQRVIDVGCGAGVTALALAERGYTVSGVDSAPRMIERARATAEPTGIAVDFTVAAADRLPYASASAEVVIALGLLSNLRDDGPALAEIWRVLKPGGRLLATVANLVGVDVWVALPASAPILLNSTRLRVPTRRLGNVARRLTGRPIKPAHVLRFGRSVIPPRYADHLRAAGWREVTYQALAFGPLHPFGLRLIRDARTIRISDGIVRRADRWQWLHNIGALVIYSARRAG
ncbi:MAG: methyltransferase domain-containing protein [Chloroflexi bacterium]|nr:methyltransferase domain-containing protein [Chloroflexota bacterium]